MIECVDSRFDHPILLFFAHGREEGQGHFSLGDGFSDREVRRTIWRKLPVNFKVMYRWVMETALDALFFQVFTKSGFINIFR